MQPQPTATQDQTDATALLTPEESTALANRVWRVNAHLHSTRRAAIGAISAAIALVSWWWLQSGSIASMAATSILLLVYLHTNHLLSLRQNENEAEVRRLARFVAVTQDVRLLGTILDLHEVVRWEGVAWFELFTAAYHALPRLLPVVQAQHAELLSTQQRARLRKTLFKPGGLAVDGYWRGPLYCLDVLAALERIGDRRDLPDVERLQKVDDLADDIRLVAERCAQVIRERIAREEGKDFLLRADCQPEPAGILLRPAEERTDTPSQQLLRASTESTKNSVG